MARRIDLCRSSGSGEGDTHYRIDFSGEITQVDVNSPEEKQDSNTWTGRLGDRCGSGQDTYFGTGAVTITDTGDQSIRVRLEGEIYGDIGPGQKITIPPRVDIIFNIENIADVCSGASASVPFTVSNNGTDTVDVDIEVARQTMSRTLSGGETINGSVSVQSDAKRDSLSGTVTLPSGNSINDSATVTRVAPSAQLRNIKSPEVAEPDNDINLSAEIQGQRCSTDARLSFVNRTNGNVIGRQTTKISEGQTETLRFSTQMPTEKPEIDVTLELSRFRSFDLIETKTFTIRPVNAVSVNTSGEVEVWGRESGAADITGVFTGGEVKETNIGEQDFVASVGNNTFFSLTTEAKSRDQIFAEGIDSIFVKTNESIVYAVNRQVKGKDDSFLMKSGPIGTLGFLEPFPIVSTTGVSDEKINEVLGEEIKELEEVTGLNIL